MPYVGALAADKQGIITEGKPYRVLFVCTGNTCRSPMAAALFHDFMLRTRGEGAACAASAGLYAQTGAPITPQAVEALEAAGIAATPQNDYRAHRARLVDEQMVEEADVVVAISAAHAMELLMRYPSQAEKITTLPFDIPDPFGGDRALYEACLDKLYYAICLKWSVGEDEA